MKRPARSKITLILLLLSRMIGSLRELEVTGNTNVESVQVRLHAFSKFSDRRSLA